MEANEVPLKFYQVVENFQSLKLNPTKQRRLSLAVMHIKQFGLLVLEESYVISSNQ